MKRVFPLGERTFVLFLCLALAPAAMADQILNWSFEAGDLLTVPEYWTGYGSHPPKINEMGMPHSVTPYHGGRYAGEAADTPAKSGGIYQTISVNPGSTGTAQVYVNILNNQNPEDPNVAMIGIDPAGGIDPLAVGVVWSSTDEVTHPSWLFLETPEVMATAAVITVFLEFDIPRSDPGNAVFFDACEVTGGLADPAGSPGTPPDTTGLTVVSAVPGQVILDYVLTDGEDLDADVDILEPRYRVGRLFDDTSLPPEMRYIVEAQASMPSSPGGNGTGTGTWRIQGVDGGLWRDAGSRTGTALVYDGLAPANTAITVDTRMCDWEKTGLAVDWEGAGLCLMAADEQSYFMVGAFESGTGPGYMVETNWYIESATGGRADAWWNLVNSGFPTDGANALEFRLTRTSGNTIQAAYAQGGSGFSTFHELDVSGTPLDRSETLLFGIVVNDETIINVDYMRTAYRAATPGTGGDGVTGLSCTTAGDPHTLVWDTLADLAPFPSTVSVQFRIKAHDYHGWGDADESDYFEAEGGISTGVWNWTLYR